MKEEEQPEPQDTTSKQNTRYLQPRAAHSLMQHGSQDLRPQSPKDASLDRFRQEPRRYIGRNFSGQWCKLRVLNPKSEIRNPKQIQNPKFECPKRGVRFF